MENSGRENNSISICINPEIRDYSESMFWGLNLRQFLFSLAGCGMSVGIFFLLRGVLGMEAVSWACILGMLPCALLGFVKYNGMTAEKFLLAVIRSEILTPKYLLFQPVNLVEECLKEEKRRGMKTNDFQKAKKK